MIIKRIKLENIRSYINQEIQFPQGSVLLSGEVGSGKSTVLLAIEFALFGISKGYLSGASLLRNGKNLGSVTLDLQINDSQVTIKRNLKRSNESVMQEHGYIVINGKKQELSALELKQAILDLLNYPPESLTKSKSLVYRYTVYTPQEEMKHILFSDKDTRLDIIRRVLGIDKYKVINDNAKILLSGLKEKRKELEALTSTFSEKEIERSRLRDSSLEFELEFNSLKPVLEEMKSRLLEKSNEIKEVESNLKKLQILKINLNKDESNIKNKSNELKRISQEINELQGAIEKIETKEYLSLDFINPQISSKENELKLYEQSLNNVYYQLSSFEIQIKNSNKVKSDIISLKKCPVCKQDVTEGHKDHIKESEDKNIKEAETNKQVYSEKEKEIKKHIESVKKQISALEKQKYDTQINQFKLKKNLENEKRILKLKDYSEEIKKEINSLVANTDNISSSIREFGNLEKNYNVLNNDLDILRNKNTNLEIQKSRLETRLIDLKNQIQKIDVEIEKQLKLKNKLNYLVKIQNWLDSTFINVVESIEKHMMFKINADFNEFFQRWFKILIETENLNIKLDENFTPVIDQNGYGIDYENLSGGEKTAAALAYRLSLNQVINTIISTINTKDIIILDEPTDGFSEDQLDRIRTVLKELNTKQTIIVSHESKIESFVETIINFNKNNHISEVII